MYTARMPETRHLRASWARAVSAARFWVLLLVLTALSLAPVLSADFIRLDDYSHLFDNPRLRQMSSAGLAAIWSKAYFNLYIPITYSVWWAVAMTASLFGTLRETAWLFHALNLVVHLVNASLVFAIVRRLLRARREQPIACNQVGDDTVALLASLVFALHPVQVESVAWISELKGLLAAMFGLLGLWWHCRSTKRGLAAIFFVAAMLSKPSAIAFPGVVFLVDRLLLGNGFRRSIVMPAWYSVPMLVLAFVTKHLQPDLNLDFIPTTSQKLVVAADALSFYISKVLVPYPLAIDYGRSPEFVLNHVPGWRVAATVLVMLTGSAAVVYALVRQKPASSDSHWRSLCSCGLSIAFLSIGPVLGFIPFGFQEFSTVADHYLYVPFLGMSLAVAGLLIRLRAFTLPPYIAAALVLIYAGVSHRQAKLWRSTETLFAHTLSVNPRSYLGSFSIADELIHMARFDESIPWLNRSLAINPDYQNANIALGLALSQTGQPDQAIEHYTRILAQRPSTVGTRARQVSSIHNNLGLLLLQNGRSSEAVPQFRQAVEIFPKSVNGHLNLGNVAFAEGRYAEAAAEFEIAQALNPGNPAIARWLKQARQRAEADLRDANARRSP
jgi:protein O-mannosyl-transferase